MNAKLTATLQALMPSIAALFAKIGENSRDGEGVTRDAFGSRESQAASTLSEFVLREGLETGFDHGGNLHMAMPGAMDRAPEVMIGSHIDSVPIGGNYDGLAGVIAGIGVLVALRRLNDKHANGLRVVGFRGEESPWFGTAYLGSKLMLGELTHDDLRALRRYDTDLSLAEHIAGLGIKLPNELKPTVPLDRLRAYFELHIEQAPLLENVNQPLGVATAIRGNIRHPVAKCFGAYAHSGAVPREYRQDALIATAKLIAFADQRWQNLIAEGNPDLVFTCGILHTNPAEHTMTKVPGEVTFSLNIGGTSDKVMDDLYEGIKDQAARLSKEHNVRFDFGKRVGTAAVDLDRSLLDLVDDTGRRIGLSPVRMPTVGHDAAMFQRRGISSSVILIRNSGGSHNPKEHMEMADFEAGLTLLGQSANVLLRN